MRKFCLFLLIVFSCAALPQSAFSQTPPSVEYTEIVRSGWTTVLPSDINESGEIVGQYYDGVTNGGFFYDGGTPTVMHPAGWTNSGAWGINDAGEVVGSGNNGGVFSGWLYSGGVYTPIIPPSWTSAVCQAINNAGVIAGYGSDGASNRGFVYDGISYTAFDPPGLTSIGVNDINERSQVVGNGLDTLFAQRGFLTDGVTATVISPPWWDYAVATGINNAGHVVGYGSANAPGNERGFLYDGSAYTMLIPPGWQYARAIGINDRGHVVGDGAAADGTPMGFLYVDGTYREVAAPTGSGSLRLSTLNEAGQIIGMGGPPPLTLRTEKAITPFRGYLISVNPIVDLASKGSDGPVGILAGSELKVTATVLAGARAGEPVDWWLFMLTPSGIESFDGASRSWRPGFFPTGGFPLRDVGPLTVLATNSLGPGPHSIYLGVDLKRNGRVDIRKLFYDVLTVFVY